MNTRSLTAITTGYKATMIGFREREWVSLCENESLDIWRKSCAMSCSSRLGERARSSPSNMNFDASGWPVDSSFSNFSEVKSSLLQERMLGFVPIPHAPVQIGV